VQYSLHNFVNEMHMEGTSKILLYRRIILVQQYLMCMTASIIIWISKKERMKTKKKKSEKDMTKFARSSSCCAGNAKNKLIMQTKKLHQLKHFFYFKLSLIHFSFILVHIFLSLIQQILFPVFAFKIKNTVTLLFISK